MCNVDEGKESTLCSSGLEAMPCGFVDRMRQDVHSGLVMRGPTGCGKEQLSSYAINLCTSSHVCPLLGGLSLTGHSSY